MSMILPNPLEMLSHAKWIYKSWAFLWLIRFVPSSVASLAVMAGLRLSDSSKDVGTIILAVSCTFLITSACSALNDYCDRHVDAINLPYRPLPAGIISPKVALGYATLAFLTGNILALGLGLNSLLFFATATFTCLTYSPFIKKLPGAKNLYVAFFCSSLFIFAGYLGGNPSAIILPAAITSICLIARELLMDIHDVEGDRRYGNRTIALLLGVYYSRWLVVGLLGLVGFLEIWLLGVAITTNIGVIVLLFSIFCFWGVGVKLASQSDISLPNLLMQIRILMVGNILGLFALVL